MNAGRGTSATLVRLVGVAAATVLAIGDGSEIAPVRANVASQGADSEHDDFRRRECYEAL